MTAKIIATLFAISLSMSSLGQTNLRQPGAPPEDALFLEDALLELTLTAPLKRMHRERNNANKYPGSLSYLNGAEPVSFDVDVQVRGKNRLQPSVCMYAPLRLRFDKHQTINTIFKQQRKLKLVTQCGHSKRHEQYLLNEYLAYRIFNIISPNSFRVRLAKMEYIEAQTQTKPRRAFTFFIEHKKNLAKRIGADLLSVKQSSAKELDSEHLNLGSLFQLLIGNVDWSATAGGTDECCHNYKLFARPHQPVLSIPYDFDLSGLVNAKYAIPDAGMKLKTIRERRYRGYCRNNHLLEQNIGLFNARKTEIFNLLEEFPYLSTRNRKSSVSYLKKFYRIINDPQRVKQMILQRCHKSYFVEQPPA